MIELGDDEVSDLMIKAENYLKNIQDIKNFKEFEIYKGKKFL